MRAPAKDQHSGRAAKEPVAKETASSEPTDEAAAPVKDAPKTRSSGRRTGAKSKADAAAAAAADSAISADAPAAADGSTEPGSAPTEPASATTAASAAAAAAPGTALAFSGASDVEASLVGALDGVAPKRTNRRVSSKTLAAAAEAAAATPLVEEPQPDEPAEDPQETATALLDRALRLGHDKDDAEWLHSSAVKTHMRRMDPSFSEKALGYRSFSDFVKARESIAELEETGHERLVRLREQ
ncbi:OST-HTH/LOTUS domain-containing protein [uncultured Microbacterium sp.]|uniref:OST-HTH/LOTUS domain-containing protein n=1 Tax=uncultured Microbacterium sp. TaxID=191216 RepID=UPI0035CB1DC6